MRNCLKACPVAKIKGNIFFLYQITKKFSNVSSLYILLPRGPRFCVTHTAGIQTASTKLKFWHSRQQKPRTDVDPFPQMVSLLPLRAKSCMPKITHSQYQVLLWSLLLQFLQCTLWHFTEGSEQD